MTETKLDPEAVEALWARYAGELRNFLAGVLRDADPAEEALQQTFVTLLERGHTAAAETRKGWLFKVAFNHAMERKRRETIGGRALDAIRRAADGQDSAPSAAELAQRTETREQLRAAIETLPAAQRQIVELRLRDGKTFAVIAEELAIPLGTALTRMRLAMAKLRERLD